MSEELRTAVLEGLRAFAEEEPDFAMSHGMRARAADFILAQPRPALEGDIVGMLRKAAAEMRSTHHAGWPNVCDAAAEALAALKDRDVVLEEAAGVADAIALEWGERWQRTSDKHETYDNGRIAGWSDGAADAAKQIRNLKERV